VNTTTTATNAYQTIRNFLYENYLYARPNFELRADDSLLSQGVIDSMGVLELVDFLRETFRIDVRDEHITEQNFGTLAGVTTYVLAQIAAEVDAA
jgi:acyl carrier protein